MSLEKIEGWKTHAVAWIYAFLSVIEGGLQIDIPGFVAPEDWLGTVFAAAGVSSARSMFRKLIDAWGAR